MLRLQPSTSTICRTSSTLSVSCILPSLSSRRFKTLKTFSTSPLSLERNINSSGDGKTIHSQNQSTNANGIDPLIALQQSVNLITSSESSSLSSVGDFAEDDWKADFQASPLSIGDLVEIKRFEQCIYIFFMEFNVYLYKRISL